MDSAVAKREAELAAVFSMRPRDIVAFFWLLVMALPVLDEVLAPAITEAFWFKVTLRVLFMLVSTAWLVSDAKLRGIPALNYYAWCVVVPDLTVPTYVIRTRGWKQFLVWLTKLAAVVLSALFLAAVLSSLHQGIHGHGAA